MKLCIALYSCFGPPGAHPTVQAPWFAILASVMHKLGNCVSMFLADFANPSWSCIALPLKAQWSEAVRCRAAEALPLCSVTWINRASGFGWFCFIYHFYPFVCGFLFLEPMNTCELRRIVLPKYGFEGSAKALPEARFVSLQQRLPMTSQHFLGWFGIRVAGCLRNAAAVWSTRIWGGRYFLATGTWGKCKYGGSQDSVGNEIGSIDQFVWWYLQVIIPTSALSGQSHLSLCTRETPWTSCCLPTSFQTLKLPRLWSVWYGLSGHFDKT